MSQGCKDMLGLKDIPEIFHIITDFLNADEPFQKQSVN